MLIFIKLRNDKLLNKNIIFNFNHIERLNKKKSVCLYNKRRFFFVQI